MYSYNHPFINNKFKEILDHHLRLEEINWFNNKYQIEDFKQFKITFALIPRKISNQELQISKEDQDLIFQELKLDISDWGTQKLARAVLLLNLNPSDKDEYFRRVDSLFLNAEMNELNALYASLILFAYPEMWTLRCAEGIRSNIGIVLDAVILYNPYPSINLSESAWNQLILKAFFTDKDILGIIGVEERFNANLAKALEEYVEERTSAGRAISQQLLNLINLKTIQK